MRRFLLTRLLTVLLSLLCAATLSTVFVIAAHAEPGPHSELTAIRGHGTGNVFVFPTAEDRPTFEADIKVNVQHMLPNSTFTVQRRVDTTHHNGVCTGTTWLTNGPIRTSADGEGAQHFVVERGAPFISGFRFDVQFRVIGNDTELRSDCMTVTVP